MASEEEEFKAIQKQQFNAPKLNPFTAPKPTHQEQQAATVVIVKLDDDDVVFGEGLEMKNNCLVVTELEEAVRSVKEEVKTPVLPFLVKIFEIVEDPETDPIVSWSETRDSFVVWDPQELSKNLLPRYFSTHSKFSSFVRQLNTYGFRKVNLHRWEFANEAFLGGKKHLLKNIKRKKKCNKLHQQGSFNSMKPCLEDEVKKLKKDQNLLKVEILKLEQQLENSHVELSNVQEQLRCAELKQHQILVFLTRIVKNPTLVEYLMKKLKRKKELDGVDMVKTPRLLGAQFPNMAMDTNRHQGSELCSSRQGLRDIGSEASVHDASFAYDVMSEELMGESSVVDEEVYVNDSIYSNIYRELEDLISNTTRKAN